MGYVMLGKLFAALRPRCLISKIGITMLPSASPKAVSHREDGREPRSQDACVFTPWRATINQVTLGKPFFCPTPLVPSTVKQKDRTKSSQVLSSTDILCLEPLMIPQVLKLFPRLLTIFREELNLEPRSSTFWMCKWIILSNGMFRGNLNTWKMPSHRLILTDQTLKTWGLYNFTKKLGEIFLVKWGKEMLSPEDQLSGKISNTSQFQWVGNATTTFVLVSFS